MDAIRSMCFKSRSRN